MARTEAQNQRMQRRISLYTVRIIPLILTGIVGYATYVFVVRLCVHYLLIGHDSSYGSGTRNRGAGIAFLVVYFVLLALMAGTYARLVWAVTVDPGYVPRGPGAGETVGGDEGEKRTGVLGSELRGMVGPNGDASEGGNTSLDRGSDETRVGTGTVPGSGQYASTDMSKEAPISGRDAEQGLEEFWKRDVFVCLADGRPNWCSECLNWKDDRTHHCSDVGRCVKKMDHFCPWVGGVVAENSFKFFVQFVTYTWIYCFFILTILAIYVAAQKQSPTQSLDPQFAVILGIAACFGLFTLGMSGSSLQFVLENLSTIENLGRKSKTMWLAIYISPVDAARIRQTHNTIIFAIGMRPKIPHQSADHATQPTTATTTDPAIKINPSAIREFVIVQTAPGQNPWNLGFAENFKQVMGNNILEWLLPIKRSPCCRRSGGEESRFRMGSVVEEMKRGLGIS